MLIDKLVKQVRELQLNLKGKTVLTEAATGAYIVTPVLAALAGAKVFAFSKTTRYGTVDEVFAATKQLACSFKEFPLDIHYTDKLTPEIISQADIITNSGHLRPLTEAVLGHAKDEVVIPLMYEAWEWREADMDINYIRKRGFKIGATNERHPSVDVFNYLGDMALKQIFDAGICLYKNKFILLCNNDFGPFIARVIAAVCDGLAVIDKDENKSRYDFKNIEWIGGFPDIRIPPAYKDAEAVIFTAYPFDQNWIGDKTPVSLQNIKSQLTDPLILRYAGDVDAEVLRKENVRFYPQDVHSGHMGILPSAVGYDPIIRLQSGGLKAGEALLSGKHEYNNIKILDLV
ncbi:MAG: hypothetical protein Q8918_13000 [Bacteroidota bacterium]|nr:hypothetical protein [Bacteroidota bacterium]MDP4251020.1 hypothetical protein [Bacteroidota bacterium]